MKDCPYYLTSRCSERKDCKLRSDDLLCILFDDWNP